MTADIAELQQLLLEGVTGSKDPLLQRVAHALSGGGATDPLRLEADLPPLIRQALLRCRGAGTPSPTVRVRYGDGWPDDRAWRNSSCTARQVGGSHYLVSTEPWQTDWLDEASQQVVLDATAERRRRGIRAVSGDPGLVVWSGYDSYVTAGQREAVRAAFLSPPGATVIINLPTGGGKTLAFQLPALAMMREQTLTVVVVPTVALAKDQEARFRHLVLMSSQDAGLAGLPLAYHAGLDSEDKARLRSAIREGGTPIVFASPEAAVGALRGSLFAAAAQGRLACLAIDEAHLVSQWGQQFRPEFQSLAGLRDALMDACPPDATFRTLLLTATLTTEAYEALALLFGVASQVEVVSEVGLRAEPGFLIASAESDSDRQRKVLEAIRHLPRPLILYTSRRRDAAAWHSLLREHGYSRLCLVRGGDLSGADGDELLEGWRKRSLDLVVATSAFGLGMDQSEVRSVVHACLPETIDRYYQEVGRAGRDGSASVALLVSTESDVGTARALAQKKIISVDRAFERWEAMWLRRRSEPNGSHVLSLDARPIDIADPGTRNAAWNLRTLVLMARARLIAFAAHAPPVVDDRDEESEEEREMRVRAEFEKYAREVAVRIRDRRVFSAEEWERAVASARGDIVSGDRRTFGLVCELRSLHRSLNDLFREEYTLPALGIRPPRHLGSCPITRSQGTVSHRVVQPDATGLSRTAMTLSKRMKEALHPATDDSGRACIAYDPPADARREIRRWVDRMVEFLRNAIALGVAELRLPERIIARADWRQLLTLMPQRFLLTADDQHSDAPSVARFAARVSVLDASESRDDIERMLAVDRPLHLLLVPVGTIHPSYPYRRLLDVMPHLTFGALVTRLRA